MAKPPVADLAHLAQPGAEYACRVTPGARHTALVLEDGVIRVHVAAAPEDGKANRAVAEVIAQWLGIAKSEVELVTGASQPTKVFRIPSRQELPPLP